MRSIAAAASLAVLTLTACSEPSGVSSAAPAPAMLSGVDLTRPVQALGTEPFWSVEITPASLTYTSPDGAPLTGANPGPELLGTTAIYKTTAGDRPLEVTLIATECSDGMSDRTYPLTAMIKLGETTLNGCAIDKAALAIAPQG